ncbi:hypothetical protein DPMN_095853 [Dreissena polymorpha]|uniref:Uncharacterized protein n=1 Tax=Dreissena polymorpha TaxID=45954 RepID=A0A9D4LA99_DREPO|nr:hypothetical protein DPMN_095853 [Dreissena polymorpha]
MMFKYRSLVECDTELSLLTFIVSEWLSTFSWSDGTLMKTPKQGEGRALGLILIGGYTPVGGPCCQAKILSKASCNMYVLVIAYFTVHQSARSPICLQCCLYSFM